MNYSRKNKKQKQSGFTLVELMVSMSVFIIILTISMGSIYSVIDANRKSQSLRSVMDNLNYSLESMTRTIRFGTTYHCDATQGILSQSVDCQTSAGASSMAVNSSGATIIYKLVSVNGKGRIARTISGVDQYLTGSDVDITTLNFRVIGSSTYNNGADLLQPQAIIVISGNVGTRATSKSTFTIQTTVSQRLFDTQ